MEKITKFCLVLINVNCFVPRKQNFLIGKLVKIFFWISNESFIEDETYFMFAMMNTKYLKKITRRSYRRSKSVLEPKNRGKMCKTPWPRANKQGTNQQGFHLIERPPNILEHTTILLLPHYPHQECWHQIPYFHWRNGKQIWFGTINKPTKAKVDGCPVRVSLFIFIGK